MLVFRPGHEHPIYLEWKKWNEKADAAFPGPDYVLANEAKNSIERIAEHLYPEGSIVGFMIMQKDMEHIETEDAMKAEETP